VGNLLPVKIPAGMYRNGDEYEAAGRWYDGNLVRWENGRLKPIGGWQALLSGGAALTGLARGSLAWTDNSGAKHLAIGTNSKLYFGSGGAMTDSTPAGFLVGRPDSVAGVGFGVSAYGKEAYGVPRTLGTLALDAATWSMDTYGQDWVGCCTSDQKIYELNVGTGITAQVANSPTAWAVFTTNEDYLMALGAGGNGKRIAWPTLGDDTVWAAASTNSAGGINLQTNGRCMAGARVGLQNIVWTTTDVHLVNFIGNPGIYGPIKIADHAGLVGPNAVCVTDVAYWWGVGGFFRYNGIVEHLPCDVQDYVFRNANPLQFAKINAALNSRYNEITWFFASINSTEVDSYVTHNYKDKWWAFGIGSAMARTTWVDRGVFPWPLAVSPAGIIYEMEQGFLANGVSRNGQVFAQSGAAEVGRGDKNICANLMLPGVGVNPASITITAKTRESPQGPQRVFGPWSPVGNAEGYVGVQFEGRQTAIRIDQVSDTDWAFDQLRFMVAGGGGR
jgi:hypothetical protein